MRTLSSLALKLYDFLVVYLGLLWLGVLCLTFSAATLLISLLLPRRRRQNLWRTAVMWMFRLFLGSLNLTRRCHFELEALDALRNEPALIIAPNHPSLLDAVMILSRLPNVACVMKADLMNNVFLGVGARLAAYIRNEPLRKMVMLARQDLQGGGQLLLFPEGTRTIRDPINPLTGSIGLISHHAQVPVQTVLIETDTRYLSKGWSLFRKPQLPLHFRVRLGRRFEPPQQTHAFMAELEHYFSHELVQGSAFYPANSVPPAPAAKS